MRSLPVGLRPATLLKKRLWHWCFLVNFVKFLRTVFLQNTSGRLLLALKNIQKIGRLTDFLADYVYQILVE